MPRGDNVSRTTCPHRPSQQPMLPACTLGRLEAEAFSSGKQNSFPSVPELACGTRLKKILFIQSGKGCPSCAKTRVGAGTAEVGEGRPRSCRRAARAGEGNWSRRRSLPSDPSFCAHTHAHTRRREGRIHCSGDFERAANDCQRRAEARRA